MRQRSGFLRVKLIDQRAEPLELGARLHAADDAAHRGGEVLRHGAVPRHRGELRHQRMGTAGERLKDGNLREPVELLDRLGDDANELKLGRGRLDAVQLDDPVREIQLGVAAPHARHVAVDDRAEFLAGFGS